MLYKTTKQINDSSMNFKVTKMTAVFDSSAYTFSKLL